MNCPDCNQAMVILEYLDVEVDFCVTCKGAWLDEGELELMLEGHSQEALDLVDWSGGRVGSRRCPRCGQKMHMVPVPDGPEIDVCPSACGIWFDQGELRALARAKLPPGAAAEVTARMTEMFGPLKDKA